MSRKIRLMALVFVILLSCVTPALAADWPVISTPRYTKGEFADMERHWSRQSVEAVVAQGLMDPLSDDQFAPDTPVTRAVLVEALYRLNGEEWVGQVPFTDVPRDHPNYAAIAWGFDNTIIEGSDDKFRPEDPLTREELVVIFNRYAAMKGYDIRSTVSLSAYQDRADVSRWASAAMSWALEHKLITGMTADTLVPGGTATRAQLAVILLRYEAAEKDFLAAPDAEIILPVNPTR